MRISAVLSALVAIAALSAPTLAQERTDWSVTAAFKATGKACTLRFAGPKGGIWLTMEHVPAKGKRSAQAFFKLGGLPPYLAADKASLRGIRLGMDDGWARGALKGDWRKGNTDANSRFQFSVPYDELLGEVAKSYALTVDVAFASSNSQSYSFDLRGSSAPVAAYSTCIASAG